MLNSIRRWLGISDRAGAEGGTDYAFRWHDPGDDNPFGIPILDVRPLTWSVIATTHDIRVAESFNALRRSDGREFVAADIDGAETVSCEFTIPHDGAAIEGVVFKSDAMEVKWDVYVYDSVFLFVHSWTGALRYRAYAEVADTYIRIHTIEAPSEFAETAPQAVYFILGTHAMGRVLPHTIPRATPPDPEQIALWSFSMFGNRACYATYEDVTKIEIRKPGAES